VGRRRAAARFRGLARDSSTPSKDALHRRVGVAGLACWAAAATVAGALARGDDAGVPGSPGPPAGAAEPADRPGGTADQRASRVPAAPGPDPAAADDPTVTDWLDRARALEARGATRRASALLRRARRRAPDDPRVLARLLELELPSAPEEATRLGADRQAEAARGGERLQARLALAPDPPPPEQARAAAWALAVGGRGEAAIALADEHLQEPARGALLDRLAALLVHQDELDRARRALLRALRRPGPATVSRLRALGVLEMARGAPEDALPWLERALRRSAEGPGVDPETSVGLHLDLAGALLAAGQRARAVAVLRTARARHPTDPAPALALARGLLEAGDPAGGAHAAEAARALGADPVETGLLLGRGYLDAGDLRRARAAFQEILEHAPGHPRAEAGLAAVRQAEGEGRR